MTDPIIVTYGAHRFELPMPVGRHENYAGVTIAIMDRTLTEAVESFVLFRTRDPKTNASDSRSSRSNQ